MGPGLYVALAEREGCGLITSDRKLINALQADFLFIAEGNVKTRERPLRSPGERGT